MGGGLGESGGGDKLYGAGETTWCPRLFLHSYRLGSDTRPVVATSMGESRRTRRKHTEVTKGLDIGDGPLDLTVPLPQDLRQTLSDPFLQVVPTS